MDIFKNKASQSKHNYPVTFIHNCLIESFNNKRRVFITECNYQIPVIRKLRILNRNCLPFFTKKTKSK